jgi:NADPH2:quinone reductase
MRVVQARSFGDPSVLATVTVADPVAGPGQVIVAVAAGRIRPVIGQAFPLDQATAAHVAIETRTVTGRTLLSP